MHRFSPLLLFTLTVPGAAPADLDTSRLRPAVPDARESGAAHVGDATAQFTLAKGEALAQELQARLPK